MGASRAIVHEALQGRGRHKGRAGEEAAPGQELRLLLQWDNILSMSTGRGLDQFVVAATSEGELPCPFMWPHLAIACDQGADNVCALSYLQFASGVNVTEQYDPSHGAWNDARAAMREVGLWPHMILQICAMNALYGSRFSPPRLQQLREASFEYLQRTNPHECPLFAANLESLLAELDLDMSPMDPGAVEVATGAPEPPMHSPSSLHSHKPFATDPHEFVQSPPQVDEAGGAGATRRCPKAGALQLVPYLAWSGRATLVSDTTHPAPDLEDLPIAACGLQLAKWPARRLAEAAHRKNGAHVRRQPHDTHPGFSTKALHLQECRCDGRTTGPRHASICMLLYG